MAHRVMRRTRSFLGLTALAVVVFLTGSAASHALIPPAARASGECICNNTTLMAPITSFLPCVDPSTLESGVLSFDGLCDIYCEQISKCSFLIYVYGDPPAGCASGCDLQSRLPPYQNSFSSTLLVVIDKDCGTSESVNAISRCNSSCTGSCASSGQSVIAAFTLECAECETE